MFRYLQTLLEEVMRDPNLIPWDYPEYFAMLRGEIPYEHEEDDYDYDYSDDHDPDDDDSCPRCGGGRGCNWCLMTEW
jgi:hypothetical protein